MHQWTARVALALAVLVVGFNERARGVDPFTIVVLPDTQNYSNDAANALLFTQQTQWIADEILVNGNPRNIQFVSHLGDVVSTGSNLVQWNRANASMSVIDGVIEYGVLPGNHDYNVTGNKSTGTVNYVSFFGPTRFAGAAWYGGADPSGNNSYQTFTAGGYDFLHLALEWQPAANVPVRSPSPIEWAQSVLDAHPDLPVILSTHEYIDDEPAGRSGAGDALWNELIRSNDQVFLVLNGHFHSVGGTNDGEYHQVSINDAGRPVFEVLQDYQDYPNGGNGWLRLIEFDIDNDQMLFETYSPVLDQFQTETVQQVGGFASQFAFDIDFADRLVPVAIAPRPSPFAETQIQQGVNGFTGTGDREIRSDGADMGIGQATTISVDGDDGSPGLQPTQALVKLTGFVGTDPGQIPPGTQIEQATLELNVSDSGSGMQVYRMLQTWGEGVRWGDFGGDGVTPGVEADPTPVTSVGGDNDSSNVGTGVLALRITTVAQAWIDGASNFGVALIPYSNGTNGIDFDSSESSNPPVLSIRVQAAGVAKATFQQGQDGYTGTVDTAIREETPGLSYGAATTVQVDNSDPTGLENHILLRFEDLFGGGAGQVPTAPGTRILLAELELEGTDAGDGATLHRLLQPWQDNVTWGGDFGGNGIQPNGVEALQGIDVATTGGSGPVVIDVTNSVLAWYGDDATNFGWALLPRGSDGWAFFTAEGAVPPVLRVYYDLLGDCNADGFVDALDWDELTACLLGPDVALGVGCGCFDLDVDDDVDMTDFADFQTYFGGSL